MKSSSPLVLTFLLLFHLLLCGAYGARLGKLLSLKSLTTDPHTNLENHNATVKKDDGKNNNIVKKEQTVGVVCKDEVDQWASKGKNRKLITSTTMSASTAKPIQEIMENGGNKNRRHTRGNQGPSPSSPPPPSSPSWMIHNAWPNGEHDEHQVMSPQKYEDLIDMTEMDYSPAKRKPPIHN